MRIIAGLRKGLNLTSPIGEVTRPTSDRSRESLFNILTHAKEMKAMGFNLHQANCADLCAGTGALGLEAISRGAKSCVFIEQNRQTFKILQKNIQAMKMPSIPMEAIYGDYRNLRAAKAVDLLLIDPPYLESNPHEMLPIIKKQGWVHQKSLLVIQTAPEFELDPALHLAPFQLVKEARYHDGCFLLFSYWG